MDIKNIYNKDTDGGLSEPLYKIDPNESALNSSIEYLLEGNPSIITVPSNIDYTVIPDIGSNMTYRYILNYNSTMGRKRLFSQLVKDEQGVLDVGNLPVFTYTPAALDYNADTKNEDVVLYVNFYTQEANILQFIGGEGNTPPFEAVYSHTFPFSADLMPNFNGQDVFLDGWYSQVFVIFKDVKAGDIAIKGNIYGYNGISGTASISGTFRIDQNTQELKIEDENGELVEPFNASNYADIMLAIWTLTNMDANASGYMVNTQTIVTEETNLAIINEIKNISLDPACDDICSIADWQRLQQKKLGAYIHFTEGNYRKAQVILESAREVCGRNIKGCK